MKLKQKERMDAEDRSRSLGPVACSLPPCLPACCYFNDVRVTCYDQGQGTLTFNPIRQNH